MKRLAFFAMLFGWSMAEAAMAQTETPRMDANDDGMVSLEEFLVAHPDMSQEDFTKMDLDGNAMLDPEENSAAEDAGLLPAPS